MRFFFASISPRNRRLLLLAIIYAGFVSLGLPDTILGVAWDAMRADFEKPVYYAGFFTALLTACSAISAFSSGAILRKTGTGKLLTICAFLTGGALLGTALAPAFWVLMLFALPLGFGQGAVDTGMNFYVAKHHTSRDMNWLHACWGLGATGGPILATALIAHTGGWRTGYATVAAVQLALGAVFLCTLPLWGETPRAADKTAATLPDKPHYSARFFCCPLMFFLYCGMEISMGLWSYQFLVGCRGFAPETAGYAVAVYWGAVTTGRILVGFIANRVGNRRQIRYGMALACLGGALMFFGTHPVVAMASIGLIGLAFAPFYPAMMHAAPARFDDATAANLIGFQGGAAMLGTASIPPLFGYLAAHSTFALLPLLVVAFSAANLLLQIKVDGLRWAPAAPTRK